MNKNGLWAKISYAIKLGVELFLQVFGAIALCAVWVLLILSPVFFGAYWMLWATIPAGFLVLFVFIAFMVERE